MALLSKAIYGQVKSEHLRSEIHAFAKNKFKFPLPASTALITNESVLR